MKPTKFANRRETWRDRMRPLIAKVIERNRYCSLSEMRAKLRAAFPYGARELHPYKIWLDECAVQLGLKKLKPRRPPPKPLEGQQELFK